MNTANTLATGALAAVVLVALAGCAGMSARDRNIAGGAGIGAVAGAVLTGGSAIGTAGGAAVGGVIGNEISKDKRWPRTTALGFRRPATQHPEDFHENFVSFVAHRFHFAQRGA